MRSILYITGTRADFGLMESTLTKIKNHPNLNLSICVTGMHLSDLYGNTINEIRLAGFHILSEVVIPVESADHTHMGIGIGTLIIKLTKLFSQIKPDIILILGDRAEMLAAAIAAVHLNIVVMHIHGGERSGTIDESVRHAISKLSHYHFVATSSAKIRLIKMGEKEETIFITGAPGLDDIHNFKCISLSQLSEKYDVIENKRIAIFLFHPVTQAFRESGYHVRQILEALKQKSYYSICLLPNSDTGSDLIRNMIIKCVAKNELLRVVTHMPRNEYLSWLSHADLLIGNSSSGIIESASFGIATINVGDRQMHRERNANIIDCEQNTKSIIEAIDKAEHLTKENFQNIYGDGFAGLRIVNYIASLSIDNEILKKSNTY